MPFAFSWLIQDRILLEQFSGRVDIAELHELQPIFTTYLDMGKPPVHLVVDLTEIVDYPKNLNQIRNAMQLGDNDKLGWIILVNPNPVLRFLTSVVVQLIVDRVRLRLFDTREEALQFLQERDPTLLFQPEK